MTRAALLSPAEAARELCISDKQLRLLTCAGKIRYINIGMGEKFEAKATKAMPAGAFGTWEAEMKHFAWVKGETIIQLHGTGPWTIKYVDPADDPRNRKTK